MLCNKFCKYEYLYYQKESAVSNFQSMKISVELNSLLLKFFCYAIWFDEIKLEALQTKPIFQILLFLWKNSLAF